MKEQSQKPRSIWAIIDELPEKVSDEDITATYRQWCVRATDYISHLESELAAKDKRIAELDEEIKYLRDYRDQERERFYSFLGFVLPEQEDLICKTCSGTGNRAYSDTSVWRGGIGGQMITQGVCDKCWGTGRTDRTGTNQRELNKRIAELERQLALITEWCKLSVEHMKQYEGDQSEYDGMYQAASDLLDRINGTMPWPDLVMERLSKVK